MSIRWITPLLGTGPASSVRDETGVHFVDVRQLVDKAGNQTDVVKQKIVDGCALLNQGKKTVVCCDYGISRSNAVAVGILAMHESIAFEKALRRVMDATGENEIKIGPLQAVRMALGEGSMNEGNQSPQILVTGGTGGLGDPLSRVLSELYKTITPSRSELDLQVGVTKLDLLAGENEINCVVHLANPRVFTSNIALGDSLAMLRNVLEVCVARNCRLIYLSSFEVYSGYRTNRLVADESLPLLPQGPYAETKYLCESLIEHFRRTQNLQCALIRSSTVYGIGLERPKFIYNFIEKIKQSRRIVTHRYNNGLPSLDLLYIDDFVAAVSKVIESDFAGNLNIGTGVTTTTTEIAEILTDIIGGQIDIESNLIDADSAGIAMDAGLAKKLLGWEATIDLRQGLQRIVDNLQTNTGK